MAFNTYKTVKSDGSEITVQAANDTDALKAAQTAGADPRSGVQLITGGAPVESPYTADLTDRYKTSDRLSEGITKETAPYNLTPEPNEAAIRTAEAARAQSLINGINMKYATIEAQDNETADLLNRERRAANVMRGLSSSDLGTAKTIETAQQGAKIKDLTAKAKGAEIQEILSKAEDRASKEFKDQKDAFILASKDKLKAEQGVRDRIKTDALTELSALAGSGSWEDLVKKNPNLMKQYMEETGLDEIALKALFLKESEANWEKIKEVASPGKQTFVYKNKTTGEVKTEDIDVPEGFKFYAGVGNDGAFINEQTEEIRYINGAKTPKSTNPTGNPTNPDGSPAPSWIEYLTAASSLLPNSPAAGTSTFNNIKAQYDAAYPQASSGVAFTSTQKLKLEQAGLINAPRQQQLDFLYGKSADTNEGP